MADNALLPAYWSPDTARKLSPGARYLFVVVAPVTMTDVTVQQHLEQYGWQVVSTGAPPPEMTASIAALAQKLKDIQGLPGPPIALRIIAIWKGGTSVLPEKDDAVMYGPIFVWTEPQGPALPPAEPTPQPGGSVPIIKDTTTQWVIAGVVGAGLLGLVWWLSKSRPTPAIAENPIKYDSTVHHHGIDIHVHQTDGGFCADYRGVLRRARFQPSSTMACGKSREGAVGIAKTHIDKILARAA